MRSSSRARPLLGTVVIITAKGGEPDAIEAAFGEIAAIHNLMSVHDPDSEISRLNRGGHLRPIALHRHTLAVLRQAQRVSAASDGVFDVTAGSPRADWRDVEIGTDGMVRLTRPLRIDLGGIAKGYAVDCARTILERRGVTQACVNAGGDLAIFGPAAEWVGLRTDLPSADSLPAVRLENACLASSGGKIHARPDRFACVVAETCVLADALTKPVLALGRKSAPILRRFGAEAHLFDRRGGWRALS